MQESCQKCGGMMKSGSLASHGAIWIDKLPSQIDQSFARKVLGFVTRSKARNTVAYRCEQCGGVEIYAPGN